MKARTTFKLYYQAICSSSFSVSEHGHLGFLFCSLFSLTHPECVKSSWGFLLERTIKMKDCCYAEAVICRMKWHFFSQGLLLRWV